MKQNKKYNYDGETLLYLIHNCNKSMSAFHTRDWQLICVLKIYIRGADSLVQQALHLSARSENRSEFLKHILHSFACM